MPVVCPWPHSVTWVLKGFDWQDGLDRRPAVKGARLKCRGGGRQGHLNVCTLGLDVKLKTPISLQHGIILFLWITIFFLDMPRWHLDYTCFLGEITWRFVFWNCLDFASTNFKVCVSLWYFQGNISLVRLQWLLKKLDRHVSRTSQFLKRTIED